MHAGAGGISSERAAGISSRGDSEFFQPEFPGHRDRHSHSARFEAAGGQAAFVLDVEILQTEPCPNSFRLQNRGDGFSKRNNVIGAADRKHFQIAPNSGRPAKKRLFGKMFLQRIEIIPNPKRPLADSAKIVKLFGLIMHATIGAFEVADKVHPGEFKRAELRCQELGWQAGAFPANLIRHFPRAAAKGTRCAMT